MSLIRKVDCGALYFGVVLITFVALASPARCETGWLSLGAKQWAPRIVSSSGIGTAKASAVAKVFREDIQGWCENWSPGDAGCVERELASPQAQRVYTASADCRAGRITPVDGVTYTFDGVWDASDIGAGRTRWRDPSGRVVGRDNASGGLDIAQQWELLCPGKLAIERARKGSVAARSGARPAAAGREGGFAAGDRVEARFGRAWVPGRVTRVLKSGSGASERIEYEVILDSGQRGILPRRMMRSPGRAE